MQEPRVLVEVEQVKGPEEKAAQGCWWVEKDPVVGGPRH